MAGEEEEEESNLEELLAALLLLVEMVAGVVPEEQAQPDRFLEVAVAAVVFPTIRGLAVTVKLGSYLSKRW